MATAKTASAAPAKKKATTKSAASKAAAQKAAIKKAVARKNAEAAKNGAPAPAEGKPKVRILQQSMLEPGAQGSKAQAFVSRGGLPNRVDEPTLRRRKFQPLQEEQLADFRSGLERMRAQVDSDLGLMAHEALKASGQDSSNDHMADHGTDAYEQEFTLSLMENEGERMRQINEALARIEDGSFGRCEECGYAIPITRLNALPFTRMCLGCQRENEGPQR